MTSPQVRGFADVYAQSEGFKLDEYHEPTVEYDVAKREWVVFYEGEEPARPGQHFIVIVDDIKKVVKALLPGE